MWEESPVSVVQACPRSAVSRVLCLSVPECYCFDPLHCSLCLSVSRSNNVAKGSCWKETRPSLVTNVLCFSDSATSPCRADPSRLSPLVLSMILRVCEGQAQCRSSAPQGAGLCMRSGARLASDLIQQGERSPCAVAFRSSHFLISEGDGRIWGGGLISLKKADPGAKSHAPPRTLHWLREVPRQRLRTAVKCLCC